MKKTLRTIVSTSLVLACTFFVQQLSAKEIAGNERPETRLIAKVKTGSRQVTQDAVLDQQQSSGGCTYPTPDNWQSFTPAISGRFSKIDVRISTNTITAGTWYVYVGKGPIGNAVTSGTYSIGQSGGVQWRTITLSDAPVLTAGTEYTFRMTSVSWDLYCYNVDIYPRGGSNQNGRDFSFRTYMIP